MPYRLGGYFMDYATARHLASHLQINVNQGSIHGYDNVDWDNTHMRYPFNDWFRRNNHLHMKAASLHWPREGGTGGLVIISTFHKFPRNQDPGDLPETDVDSKVKEWLVANGAGDLHWVSFIDNLGITLNGTQPQLTTLIIKPVTEEQMLESWRESNESLEKWKRKTGYQSLGHYLMEKARVAATNEPLSGSVNTPEIS